MASKYDGFWRGELGTIRDLLQQAYETDRSSELDISELRNHGIVHENVNKEINNQRKLIDS